MNTLDTWEIEHQGTIQAKLIGHGALVILIALIAGMMLGFSLVEGIRLWPFIDLSAEIPGSTRGWRMAHTGGIMNGVLVIAIALTLCRLKLTIKQLKWVYWLFTCTAWGNTIFYWLGNFASNRGLSVGATKFGEGDLLGALAYLIVSPVMLLTIAGCWIIMRAAFQQANSR